MINLIYIEEISNKQFKLIKLINKNNHKQRVKCLQIKVKKTTKRRHLKWINFEKKNRKIRPLLFY